MKFLIIDDNVADRIQTVRTINDCFPQAEVFEADSLERFETLLAQSQFDLLITEYRLGWTDGLKLFLDIHQRYALPVIMLTAYGNEMLAVTAIKSGMADYVVKANVDCLGQAIGQALLRQSKANDDNWQSNITHFIGGANDLSNHHEMEVLLARKEAKLRAIFDNVFDGIFIVDEDGLIERTNPSIEKIFAYPPNSLTGQHIQLLIGDPDWSWCNLFSSHRPDGQGSKRLCSRLETYGLRQDGSSFSMELSIIEINLESRHMFVCTVHDVSKHKQAEDALRKLGSHLELAREEERARIAREIHDELGSFLTVLKMDLSWLIKQLPADLPLCLNKTVNIIWQVDEAIQTVRRIITDLRPSVLDHLGLFAAIEWRVEKFRQQSGIECLVSLPETVVEIDEKHSMAVFRIMQEALTNIVLHAMASIVFIKVNVKDGNLVMRIEDNGRGITDEQIENSGRYGIKGMHERARYFGGELSFYGRPGQGVLLSLRMPIQPS
jgi:PAS domain S-box-containing protein